MFFLSIREIAKNFISHISVAVLIDTVVCDYCNILKCIKKVTNVSTFLEYFDLNMCFKTNKIAHINISVIIMIL